MSSPEPYFDDGQVRLFLGDCLDVLAAIPDCSIDAVVCDPPYGLAELPANLVTEALAQWLSGNRAYVPNSGAGGFMGRDWDKFVPPPAAWDECLRVLKPGGHLLAFAGSRTQDLMGLSIRLAGFEIRDSISWMYGQGFPKSLAVGKAIDKAAGAERPVIGHDATQGHYDDSPRQPGRKLGRAAYAQDAYSREMSRVKAITAPATEDAARREGWGTALKPACEPIVVARKPFAGTVAANVTEHGTGALNIDGCRVGEGGYDAGGGIRLAGNRRRDEYRTGTSVGPHVLADAGRWPPNVLLGEDAAAELDRQSGTLTSGANPARRSSDKFRDAYGEFPARQECVPHRGADAGGASRFFPVFRWQAKAPASERPRLEDGTAHPTVKPLELMRWLVRLVTPPGGTVGDFFAGSGTTGEACLIEGFNCVLVEKDPASAELIKRRLSKPIQPVMFGEAG